MIKNRNDELSRFTSFSLENKEELFKLLDSRPGIFIVRESEGLKNIVHIGTGVGKGGLRMRISQIFNPGHLQSTNLRLRQLLKDKVPMDIDYCFCESAESAKTLKEKLKQSTSF